MPYAHGLIVNLRENDAQSQKILVHALLKLFLSGVQVFVTIVLHRQSTTSHIVLWVH